VESRLETANPCLYRMQPVHSSSLTGICGVGAVTSPGPLHSPGSSSDSNGGDAEGPGPPAPVSDPLPLHPSRCRISSSGNQHGLPQSFALPPPHPPHSPPLPFSPCLFLLVFFSSMLSGLLTGVYFIVPISPGTGQVPQCCPLFFCVLQVTFQQICKDVHLVKHQGQQLFIESRARPLPRSRLPGEWVMSWTFSPNSFNFFFFFFFVVLGLELGAYTLSHSTSPFL
jgi:hypothetical protein